MSCSITVISDENIESTSNGAKLVFSTTDIGATSKTPKMMLDTSGVSINTGINKFTLPIAHGTAGRMLQVMESSLGRHRLVEPEEPHSMKH